MAPFRTLRSVTTYHLDATRETDRKNSVKLAETWVELGQYILQCCLRTGDEPWHPWKHEMSAEGKDDVWAV